ncbi:hypothetical protein PR048_012470 [Dryococelus australis]|uniref:Uncharacterized protein n=1 Tax=Dryococelus australis TaxID=614101 RepID=A0ABQ9HPI3_9NEOP|nr:hypothetical protein PR048_012470 [Dryococelus australis]
MQTFIVNVWMILTICITTQSPLLSPCLHHLVALPMIKQVTFSVDIGQWQNVAYLFDTRVAQKCSLRNAEKLSYLKLSELRESPSLIQSLPLTPDNYEVAWTLRGKWYNNRHLIVSHHIDALNASHKTLRMLDLNLRMEWELTIVDPTTLPTLS